MTEMIKLPTVSPSQMRMWDECPQNWHYLYREELWKPRPSKMHFDFGLYAHELQHVYYQTMKATNQKPGSPFLLSMMEARVKNDLVAENIETLSLVWPRLQLFFSQISPKIDAGITILEAEYEFHVEVVTPNGHRIHLHGVIDLIYRDLAGTIWIRDHKTGAKDSYSQDSCKLDDQLLFYAVAMTLLKGKPILGVEINWINSTPYKNKQPPIDKLFKTYRHTHLPQSVEVGLENILAKVDKMFDTKPHKNYRPACQHCLYFPLCYTESRGQPVAPIKGNYTKGRPNDKYRNPKLSQPESTSEYTSGDSKISLRIPSVR